MTGRDWVDQCVSKIEKAEDEVYASIGAYDPEAFQKYLANERERLQQIADKLDAQGYNWDLGY